MTAAKPTRRWHWWLKGTSQERGERNKEHHKGDPTNNQPRTERNVEDPGEKATILCPIRKSHGGDPREIRIFNGLVGGADPSEGLSPERGR